jgi:hypothetical protein
VNSSRLPAVCLLSAHRVDCLAIGHALAHSALIAFLFKQFAWPAFIAPVRGFCSIAM